MELEIDINSISDSKIESFKSKIIQVIQNQEKDLKDLEYDIKINQINNSLFYQQIDKLKELFTNHKTYHLQRGRIDKDIINVFFALPTISIDTLSLLTIKNNNFTYFILTLLERAHDTIETYCKKTIEPTLDSIYEDYCNTIETYKDRYNDAKSSIYHQAINKKKIEPLMKEFYIDYSERLEPLIEKCIDSILNTISILPISNEEKLLYIEQACLEITTIIIKEWANKYVKDFLLETQKELFEKSHTERLERRLNELNKNKKPNSQTVITNDRGSTEHLKKEIPEEIESFFDKIQSSINGKEKDIKNFCIRLYNKGKWIDFDKIQKDYNISQDLIDQYKKEATELDIEIYEKPIDNLTNLIKNVLENNHNEKVHKDSIALQKSYSIEDLDNYSNVSDFLIEVWYTFKTKNIENNFNKDRNRWLKSDKALKNEFINKINQWNIWREYCTPEKDAIKFNQGWWKRIYKHNNTNVIFWYAKDHDEHDRNLLQRKKT